MTRVKFEARLDDVLLQMAVASRAATKAAILALWDVAEPLIPDAIEAFEDVLIEATMIMSSELRVAVDPVGAAAQAQGASAPEPEPHVHVHSHTGGDVDHDHDAEPEPID